MKKFKAVCVAGRFEGREGYTFTKQPNEYGLILWYSKEGKFPYRTVLPIQEIKFI